MRVNDNPETTIRVSPGAYDRVFRALEQLGAKPKTVIEDEAIVLLNPAAFKKSLDKSKAFTEGLVSIQDQGAIEITRALNPEQGDTVLDMCAAPGGKTGHIAQLVGDSGHVYAADIYPQRLGLIKENIKRLKLDNVETILQDGTVYEKEYDESFDKILVDAPCSGLGVIRRKPDIRYRVKKEEIKDLTKIQSELLENAYRYLKPGGKLIYSTCTVGSAENEDIVEGLLSSNEDAVLVEDKHTGLNSGDCFYYALIEKEK